MTTAEIMGEMDTLKESIEEWEQQRAALESKLAPARRELEHWAGILKIRLGDGHSDPQIAATIDEAVDNAVAEAAEGYGAKSNGLRAFIRNHTASGVTLSQLKEEAVRLGAHPNMAYRLVTRLSTETDPPELERQGGRIYPTEHLKGE
jgi:hypothetical protein